jgi:amino acid permease
MASLRGSVIRIRVRKFELSLLQHLFLGRSGNLFFTLTVPLDMYGITWTFCSIFGAALAYQLPVPGISWSYDLWILGFVLVAITLSCTSILDQLHVQLAF